MKRRFPWLTATLVALGSFAAAALIAGGRAPDEASQIFQAVLERVSADAVDSVAPGRLYELAARGLVEELKDPYADLYSPEELASFSRNTLGNDYGGVGMLIEDQRGRITVTRVFPNTPAEHGGVQTGDRITGVDSLSIAGWRLDQVTGKLLGPIGTPVGVTFSRGGVSESIRVRFIRAAIHVPAVPYAVMLDGGVGYIPLQRFSDASASEVSAAVRRLVQAGARGLILDLRGNPGGSLDQSVQLSNLFLKHGQSIVTVRYRNQPTQELEARQFPVAESQPMVVLVDGYSASASEIVAGALQDHDRALVVGTTSFGKGLVQTLFPLDDGWALKLTTGKWYTPSGRSIQRERKLVNGRLVVQEPPDSLETDSVRHSRPSYKSDAGRVVYGGGGITPDVIVPADTATLAEQTFLKALAPKSQESYITFYNLALAFRGSVRSDFTVPPAWRDSLFSRLQTAGVPVERLEFDAAGELVDRMLEQRIASLAFGDSAAFRRGVPYDPQLSRSLELLRASRTQQDLLAIAARKG